MIGYKKQIKERIDKLEKQQFEFQIRLDYFEKMINFPVEKKDFDFTIK